METSLEIVEIAKALVAAQKEITFAAKNATNPHLKNRYADLSSVIEAVKVPLNNNGIAFVQTPGESSQGYLTLTTVLIHESGQWIRSMCTLPLIKHDCQGYGSALTYARRYALSAIIGIFQDDDDGHAGSILPKAIAKEVAKAHITECKKILSQEKEDSDHELARFAKEAASEGSDFFREFWKNLPGVDREKLKPNIEEYKKICTISDGSM